MQADTAKSSIVDSRSVKQKPGTMVKLRKESSNLNNSMTEPETAVEVKTKIIRSNF